MHGREKGDVYSTVEVKTKRVEQLQQKRKLNNYNNKERLTTFKNKEMYEYTYSIRIATKEIEELQNYN